MACPGTECLEVVVNYDALRRHLKKHGLETGISQPLKAMENQELSSLLKEPEGPVAGTVEPPPFDRSGRGEEVHDQTGRSRGQQKVVILYGTHPPDVSTIHSGCSSRGYPVLDSPARPLKTDRQTGAQQGGEAAPCSEDLMAAEGTLEEPGGGPARPLWSGGKWVVTAYPVRCPAVECGGTIKTYDTLRNHLRRHGLPIGITAAAREDKKKASIAGCVEFPDGTFVCQNCGVKLATRATARGHLRDQICSRKWAIPSKVGAEPELEAPEDGQAEAEEEEAKIPVTCYGLPLEEVEEFKYLGRVIGNSYQDGVELKRRCTAGLTVFAALINPLFKNPCASRKTKLRILRAVCEAVVMYGAESWGYSAGEWARLDSLQQRMLRRCLGWRPKVTSLPQGGLRFRFPRRKKVLRAAQQCRWSVLAKRSQVRALGNILRMRGDSLVRRADLSTLRGRTRIGARTRTSLAAKAEEWAAECGLTRAEAADRGMWMRHLQLLCSSGNNGSPPTTRERPRRPPGEAPPAELHRPG